LRFARPSDVGERPGSVGRGRPLCSLRGSAPCATRDGRSGGALRCDAHSLAGGALHIRASVVGAARCVSGPWTRRRRTPRGLRRRPVPAPAPATSRGCVCLPHRPGPLSLQARPGFRTVARLHELGRGASPTSKPARTPVRPPPRWAQGAHSVELGTASRRLSLDPDVLSGAGLQPSWAAVVSARRAPLARPAVNRRVAACLLRQLERWLHVREYRQRKRLLGRLHGTRASPGRQMTSPIAAASARARRVLGRHCMPRPRSYLHEHRRSRATHMPPRVARVGPPPFVGQHRARTRARLPGLAACQL